MPVAAMQREFYPCEVWDEQHQIWLSERVAFVGCTAQVMKASFWRTKPMLWLFRDEMCNQDCSAKIRIEKCEAGKRRREEDVGGESGQTGKGTGR